MVYEIHKMLTLLFRCQPDVFVGAAVKNVAHAAAMIPCYHHRNDPPVIHPAADTPPKSSSSATDVDSLLDDDSFGSPSDNFADVSAADDNTFMACDWEVVRTQRPGKWI